jgi:predicted Kef-type K+ transport protein
MTSDDSPGRGDNGIEESQAAADIPVKSDPDVADKGVAKTMLLTIPLFMKFVAVLLIKFVTDIIVFPLLLFYRVAHNGKRKLLRLFSSKDTNKPNGEASP